MRTFTRLLCAATLITLASTGDRRSDCTEITRAFKTSSSHPACRCFTSGLRADETGDTTWIGCTQKDLLVLHSALDALGNATKVSKLWMWDCSLPVLIPALFNKVRPMTLKIETSTTRKWANGVFDQMADRLKNLELKQNQILELNSGSFAKLQRLTRLDLSGNNVSKLTADSLGELPNLRQLYLQKNEIKTIADGAFMGMPNLRHLNLAHNNLGRITRETFKGLDQLETLILNDNHIAIIEPGAFDHMARLKSLNLGRNLLTELQLSQMPALRELLLYRNAFNSFDGLQLRKRLDSLNSLSLDRNFISRINEHDLQNMPQLNSLLLAFNQIEFVHENALHPVKNLRTLSLQNNALTHIHDGLFLPVMLLENLLLSDNNLDVINERTFYGLRHLKVLVLTNNHIAMLHKRALAGTFGLQRLYINQNQLRTLQNGTFLYINNSIRSIDLSDNPWHCNCSLVWLTSWLAERRPLAVNVDGSTCHVSSVRSAQPSHHAPPAALDATDFALRMNCLNADGTPKNSAYEWPSSGEAQAHSVWITAIAIVLAVVSLMILGAIAVLYAHELRRGVGGMEFTTKHYGLGRAPSDMVHLISPSSSQPTHSSTNGQTNPLATEPAVHNVDKKHQKHVRFQSNMPHNT